MPGRVARSSVLVAVVAGVAGTAVATATGAQAASSATALRAGSSRTAGVVVSSPHGTARAVLGGDGRFVVQRHGRTVWAAGRSGTQGARLVLRRSGNLVLRSGTRVWWSSATAGSHATRLMLSDAGVLTLRSAGGTAWNSARATSCRTGPAQGRRIVVDLSRQFAWACAGRQQLLVTAVTTGASALGMGTPTGTWQLQAKQRDRYLYPAAGGAYWVRYWMPYDGDYGLHDSSWQRFPYGSSAYRTKGSHGCVHVPARALGWLFRWAPIGTTVRIQR